MPEPTRTPTVSAFTNFTDQLDQQLQLQEAIYAWHLMLLAAGGTVTRSSTGAAVADSDLWTAATDVGTGLAGTGAWITGALGGSPGGSTLHYLLGVDDNAAPFQRSYYRYADAPYTGGNTTTLPTTAGNEITAPTTGNLDIIQWALQTNGMYVYSTTADGDWWLAVKELGTSGWRFLARYYTFFDGVRGGGGQGTHRAVLFVESQSQNVISMALYENAANWRNLNSGGATPAASQTSGRSTIGAVALGWTGGTAFDSTFPPDKINIFDANAASGRFIGQPTDDWATPDNLPWGAFDSRESGQTHRKVNFGDGIALYLPTANLGAEGPGAIP